MYRAAAEAARRTGARLHLLVAGWAASEEVQNAFRDGARRYAPGVRVSFVDGVDRDLRFAVWKAAGLFISLSDNIQETFGLVIVEALASGLPIVASDWNGYRDLVTSGEHGYLVPTRMVSGATDDATTRLVLGEISYDHFLAECSQAVTVDVPATAKALSKLIVDSELRARIGRAGRQRAMTLFDWQHVIREYERVWSEQEQQRAAAATDAQPAKTATPTLYPSPEHTFTGYPTQWLADADLLEAAPDARQCLADLLTTPLTNHFAQRRFSDHDSLYQILASQSGAVSVSAWLSEIERLGSTPQEARRTLAWLLKYDLLRHHAPDT